MWNFCILLTIAVLGTSNAFHLNSTHDNIVEINGCQTLKDEWKCCETSLKIEKFKLTACVDVKLLRKNMGMELSMTINNYTIIDEEISARNPPPICTHVPYIEDLVEACVKFYNMDWENQTLSGCLALEAKLVHLKSLDLKIGCFKFPLTMDEISKRKFFLKKLLDKYNKNLVQVIY
ncbi:uncharacterized protein LOC106661745 [Cimex lectularius]|uniref:DUF4773 domain-containing protein n=1 Tax=Cimex lectularius TaxID=79782 RepID=A0A8I6TBH8_CIMLE|nr:uncharacterized protein LOC106661745 [Cimex lectularius]